MKRRTQLGALLGAGALSFAMLGVAFAATTGPSDRGVTPTLVDNANITADGNGNSDTADCAAADALTTGNTSGSKTTTNGVKVTWTYNGTTKAFSFVAEGGLVTVAYIKGGNGYNVYDYLATLSPGVEWDGHLYAPMTGKDLDHPAGLSHAVFCTGEGNEEGPETALISTVVHLGTTDDGDAAVVVDDGGQAEDGDSVHDSAVLTFTGGGELPEGSTVTFNFYTNGACSGEPSDQSDPIDVGGETSPLTIDPGLAEGPLAAGEYSFMASFSSGDAEAVADAAGDCEPFVVFTGEELGETDDPQSNPPTLPNTAAFGGNGTSGPADGAWLLVVALGVLLASIVVLTPARAKSRR